jgi:hypothetical protein
MDAEMERYSKIVATGTRFENSFVNKDVFECKKIKKTGHVARMGKTRNA